MYAHPRILKSLQSVLPPKLQDKELVDVQRRDEGYIGPRMLKVDLSGRSKRGKLVLNTKRKSAANNAGECEAERGTKPGP